MGIALIIYVILAMALATTAVHQQNQPAAWPRHYPFYLSFFRFLALSVFILLSYPFLFRLDPANTVLNTGTHLWPVSEVVGGFSLMMIINVVLIWLTDKLALPTGVLLLQGILFSTWLFGRVATDDQSLPVLWPAWQFIGASLVVYGASLLLAEIALWVANARHIMSIELSRLVAVLPAVLIYCLGLSVTY